LASETEAHSNDDLEEDSGKLVYHVKEKEGQSAKVKDFSRMARTKRKYNKLKILIAAFNSSADQVLP
jgi:hypothetical protein